MTDAALKIILPIITAIIGIIGVFVGGWVSRLNNRDQRRQEFVARQLTEFYGPLLSIRTELKARAELRNRIAEASDEEWRKICDSLNGASPQVIKENLDARGEKFRKIIDYDNESLRTTLMPGYRRMLEVFRDRLWIAEPDARQYFEPLVEFVDVWDRFLEGCIPGEVITAIGHSEAKLLPFYNYLEGMVDQLRNELSRARR